MRKKSDAVTLADNPARREAVAKVVQHHLDIGDLGENLSDIAFLGAQTGLNLSRQTLHNWLHMKYLPTEKTLDRFLAHLEEHKSRNREQDDFMDINRAVRLYAFFSEVRKARRGLL